MHKLKIHQLAKITFLTAFLAACGGTDAPLGGNSDLQANAKSTQANAAELPLIQMQDAAGAIITGFNYDAQAVAASVTKELAQAAAGQSAQAPEPAKALGFIVKYKADVASHSMSAASVENLSKPSANSMSAMQAAGSKVGIQLSYGMRLAVGAHTLKSDKFLSQADALALAAAMKQADPSIEFVEPDYIFTISSIPNDSLYTSQWHYGNSPRYGGGQYGISLPSAWNITNGAGAKVAVIDSGYTDHPDLLPNILPGYDFISHTYISNDGGGRDADAHDPGDGISTQEYPNCPVDTSSWHGTHVSGTVAAVTNNGIGVAGVAFGAKVVPVRVLGRCGGLGSDITDGIIWAAGGNIAGVPTNPNPVHVINLSIGSKGACTQSMQTAIDYAVKVGVTVVVASGNYGIDAAGVSPANCNNVISAAASDANGFRASFSDYGAVVDIAAPGVRILSTINGGSQSPGAHTYTDNYSGTSMATPHVAGVAALLKVQNPARSHFDIEYLIKRSAYALGAKCTSCGTGLLDAYAALTASGTGIPVFRLNNKSLPGAYLFTAYGFERDDAFAYYNFGVEGVAFHVQAAPAAGMSPVTRFRDKDTGAYLFSIYETEIASLRTTYAYKFVEEGTSWYASKTPRAGWSPLYRFRNKTNGTYTFTAYESERVSMNTTYSATFVEEGVAYYIMP